MLDHFNKKLFTSCSVFYAGDFLLANICCLTSSLVIFAVHAKNRKQILKHEALLLYVCKLLHT